MKWHRQRCPTGNIKISVGEAHGSFTPMGDLTKARLLVNVLHSLQIGCVLVQANPSDIPSQEEEEAEPSCALRGTRNALHGGSSAAWGLLLGYDCLCHVAFSVHLPFVDTSFLFVACHVSNRHKTRHKQLRGKKPQLRILGIGATVTALVDLSGELEVG